MAEGAEGTAGFRFARDVSADAPKPGHHLATASLHLGDDSCMLWVIEGPANDTMSFRGLVTNFQGSRLLRYSLRGPLVEQLNEVPQNPYSPELAARLETNSGNASELDTGAARVVFSSVRGPNGMDAEGALARFETKRGLVHASLVSHRRGWFWAPVVVTVSISIKVVFEIVEDDLEWITAVEFEAPGASGPMRVSGRVRYQSSIMAGRSG